MTGGRGRSRAAVAAHAAVAAPPIERPCRETAGGTFRALRTPQLPPVLHRPEHLPLRHLDADHRPGVARPPDHRLEGRARHGDDAAVPADHDLRAVRGRHRRPRAEAELPHRHAVARDGRRRSRWPRSSGPATSQLWHVYVLALVLGLVERVRPADAAGVRDGDGRPRRPDERRRAELRHVQRRAPDRPGDRRLRHRGRRREGGVPAQRRSASSR